VRVNVPSPIWLVRLPIWGVITPIRGLPNPIRQVVPLISHILSYPPHHCHIHPPSRSFSSTTLPSSQNPKLSHPSYLSMTWSWVDSEYSIRQVQHTPSTVYTKHSIHRVQHSPSTVYTEYSIHWVQHTPSTVFTKYSIHWVHHTPSTASTQECLSFFHSNDYELTPECSFSFWHSSLHNRLPSARTAQRLSHIVTFPRLRVYYLKEWVSAPGAPSIAYLQILVQTRSIMAYKFAPSWPPSGSPHSHDYCL